MNTNVAFRNEPGLKSRIFSMNQSSRKLFGIPGIIFIIILIMKNPFVACTNGNSQFYNNVLNDFDSTSYFIALDIKSPFYKGRTIIENDNLYHYLQQTRGFDKEKYKSFMKRILNRNKTLKVEEKDIELWKFQKVYELESVIQAANRGKDNFIANYFNGIVLNYGIPEKERNAIINQLFYWGIPAKFDNLTGDLVIG
jgi:hypothetical protein